MSTSTERGESLCGGYAMDGSKAAKFMRITGQIKCETLAKFMRTAGQIRCETPAKLRANMQEHSLASEFILK